MYNVGNTSIDYCSDLMSYSVAQISQKQHNIALLDLPICIPLNEDEENALQSGGCVLSAPTYQRMVKDGEKFHASCYMKQGERSNDSFVKLTSGEYAVLRRIIPPTPDSSFVRALVRHVNVQRNAVLTHPSGENAFHIRACSPNFYGTLRVIDCADIKHKVMKIDLGLSNEGIMYVADMLKNYEKD